MDKKMKILIVDDASINRRILRNLLQDQYEIVEAENGVEALDVLETTERVHVILLDLMMPKMNGLEFLEIIKKDERYKDIPVVVNSQAGEQENEIKALELGADDFIAKPYNPKVAQRRVANLVDKYIYQKEAMQQKITKTQDHLSTLIDTVPGGIAVFHVEDTIRLNYFNDGFCRILGYSKEEIEAQIANDPLRIIVKEDRELFITNAPFKTAKNDEDKKKSHQWKFRVVRKDGEIRWISITAKVLESEPKDIHTVLIDITEEKDVENQLHASLEQLKYRAEHDTLTGILNREAFCKLAEKIMKENGDTDYVIGMWNVDRFKVINELFGSKIGDTILRGIARSLERLTADVGVCGRFEADGFAICVPEDYLNEHMVEIETLLTGNTSWEPNGYPVMSHLGLFKVEDMDTTVNLMCDRASMALMQIRGSYLQRWTYYTESLKESIITEQELVNDMETALKERQFVVHYQPMIDAKSKNVIRAEALVRWNHPKKGMISPGLFIPLFESNGFISKLDMYVCEEVCRFQAELQEKGIRTVPISLNLSRMNFYNPKLCKEILRMVLKHGIKPDDLEIEITESAYKENCQDLIQAIHMFQKCGFKVLMDDFGSGYSSLNMLKDLSMDILKIDMKFIDNLEDSERAANIMFSIIRMAQSLDMDTIAEGVETQNQYEMLSSMGCDCIQGYYFSRPLPAEEFAEKMLNATVMTTNEDVDSRQTILLVDDVEFNLDMLSDILGDKYHILTASSGNKALEVLKKEFVSVKMVISDINMPDGDGFELLEKMQEHPTIKDIPVLMVTAYDDDESMEKALSRGALDVITKPYDTDILRRRIENILKLAERQNIEFEVHALRESAVMKKQIEGMLMDNNAGMMRIKVQNHPSLNVTEVIFVNRTLEQWCPSVERRNIGKPLDELMIHFDEGIRAEFKEKLFQAVEQKADSWQYSFTMRKASGLGKQYILSFKMAYVEREVLLDCIAMEIGE